MQWPIETVHPSSNISGEAEHRAVSQVLQTDAFVVHAKNSQNFIVTAAHLACIRPCIGEQLPVQSTSTHFTSPQCPTAPTNAAASDIIKDKVAGELCVSEPVQSVLMEPLRQREPPPPPPPPRVQSLLFANGAHIMEARPAVNDKRVDSCETGKFQIELDYMVRQSSASLIYCLLLLLLLLSLFLF